MARDWKCEYREKEAEIDGILVSLAKTEVVAGLTVDDLRLLVDPHGYRAIRRLGPEEFLSRLKAIRAKLGASQ